MYECALHMGSIEYKGIFSYINFCLLLDGIGVFGYIKESL